MTCGDGGERKKEAALGCGGWEGSKEEGEVGSRGGGLEPPRAHAPPTSCPPSLLLAAGGSVQTQGHGPHGHSTLSPCAPTAASGPERWVLPGAPPPLAGATDTAAAQKSPGWLWLHPPPLHRVPTGVSGALQPEGTPTWSRQPWPHLRKP